MKEKPSNPMILFTGDLFTNIKQFALYMKPPSDNQHMIYGLNYILNYLIYSYFLNETKEKEIA